MGVFAKKKNKQRSLVSQGHERATVNATGCSIPTRRNGIFHIFTFSFWERGQGGVEFRNSTRFTSRIRREVA